MDKLFANDGPQSHLAKTGNTHHGRIFFLGSIFWPRYVGESNQPLRMDFAGGLVILAP